MNDFERLKETISLKGYADTHLDRTKAGYICPGCGSGTKGAKTGGLTIKGDFWKCFACNRTGDIFDLIGLVNHTDDKRRQLELAAQYAGATLDDKPNQTQTQTKPKAKQAPKDYSEGRKEEAALIQQAQQALEGLTEESEAIKYLKDRGITKERAISLRLGYNAQTKRLVIPLKGANYYHIDRDITDKQSKKYIKPGSEKVGAQPIWNLEAIRDPKGQPLVIVEGAFDALAVELADFNACALLSSKHTPTTRALQTHAKEIPLICLALDADKTGRGATTELKSALEAAGANVCEIDFGEYSPDTKDAADIIAKGDISALTTFLSDAIAKHEQILKEEAQEANKAALKAHNLFSADDIAFDIQLNIGATKAIPTGIKKLDEYIGGGLNEGYLYVIGAISSLGKTTLAIQIADYIAAHGRTVIFATVEQSAKELVTKSFSRMMYTEKHLEISAQDMINEGERKKWNKKQEQNLLDIATLYSHTIAPRLHFLESLKRPDVKSLEAGAQMIQEIEGEKPVILIDYLQLLAPLDERDTDKQAVDKNITALRILARKLKTPIFVISSINREAYNGAIELSSFKESGAIEYGADVLLGMQPFNIATQLEGIADASKRKFKAYKIIKEIKEKDIREIEITILKNRHGKTPQDKDPIKLTYNSKANHFKE